MKELDFDLARKKAIDDLSRFYSLQAINVSDDSLNNYFCYELELEVLKEGKTLSLKLSIFLDPDFPLSLPTIYLSKADITNLGFLPNIDTNGLICTFDANTNIPNPEAPERVLEVCVEKAKSIIEDGLAGDNLDKYDNEFIAYWENKFESEDDVDGTVLSLISETDQPPDTVHYVLFQPSIGRFCKLIYSKEEQFDKLKIYFERRKITCREIPTFYLGTLDIWAPPYHMDNAGVLNIVNKLGLKDQFTDYLNSRPSLPIVTFSRNISSRMLVFGWRHKPVQIRTLRRGGKFVQTEKPLRLEHYNKILDPKNSSVMVQRFSPQIFERDRLNRRASADYSKNELTGSTKVMIAGLGSIGSNLVPFFEKSGVVEYRLVDNDVLSLDNLGRHFLGISDSGKKKTEALRDYLERRNPLTIVHTREKKIVPLVQEEPTFLTACDFYFFCTGDVNSEWWLANNINGSKWNRPSFFIWVEPYLAGGHCVYLNGIDSISWNKMFPDNRFIYNVISEQTHQQTSFVKREAGCQVTFLPYSAANLQLFIAALYPKILNIFKKRDNNKCFSWIGDLSVLREMNISTSQHVDGVESFSLLERQL